MSIRRLTPVRLETAITLLGEYPFGSYDIALARISDTFGFKVTEPELSNAFQRAGLLSPDSYMSDAPRKHCPSCRCKVKE